MARSIVSSSTAVLSTVICMLAFTGIYAFAQQPVDSDLWKQRCMQLSAQTEAIDKDSAPPELLRATRGIPGGKFAAVGFERGHAGQHYIACTMYFTAAMAEHVSGGHVDNVRAHNDVVFAGAELKQATGQPLSLREKMDRTSKKANPLGKELTPEDLHVIYLAFGDSVGAAATLPPPEPGQEPNLHVAGPVVPLKPGEQPNPFATGQVSPPEPGQEPSQQPRQAPGPQPSQQPTTATAPAPPAANPQDAKPQEAKPQEAKPQEAKPQRPRCAGVER